MKKRTNRWFKLLLAGVASVAACVSTAHGEKILFRDEPPRVVWTSPVADMFANIVCPTEASDRVVLNLSHCHPDMVRRTNSGQRMGIYDHWPDVRWSAYTGVMDMRSGQLKTYPAEDARRFSHAAWSGDGEFIHMGGEVLESYDVRGCNYLVPGERPTSDRRSQRVEVPFADDYLLWGRGRAWQGRETLHVSVDGKALPDVSVDGTDWHWVELGRVALGPGQHVVEVFRGQAYPIREGNVLRNPGFEEGLQGSVSDSKVTSMDTGMADSGKQSVKLSGLLTGKSLSQPIALEMRPEYTYRLSFWMRGKFTKGSGGYCVGPHTRGGLSDDQVLPRHHGLGPYQHHARQSGCRHGLFRSRGGSQRGREGRFGRRFAGQHGLSTGRRRRFAAVIASI